jgi:hypothetical protein
MKGYHNMQLKIYDSLIHVTVDTGHSLPIPRDFVRQKTRDILAPLVAAGGGQVPNMPFEFSLVEQPSGAATVDFRYVVDGVPFPVVVGTICYDQSEKWWKHLLRTATRAGVAAKLAKPKSTPWLGVVRLLSPLWLCMSPDEEGFLGGLENWVAWTWLRMREPMMFSGKN